MIEVRVREQVVDGVTFLVPTNVSRAEGERVKGWQVRFKSSPSSNRYFGDSAFRDDPQLSLNAAAKYANQVRPFTAVASTLEAGMRWTWKHQHLYLECSPFKARAAAKRLYAGTVKTTSESRQAQVWARGLELRAQMMSAHAERNTKLRRASASQALKKVLA